MRKDATLYRITPSETVAFTDGGSTNSTALTKPFAGVNIFTSGDVYLAVGKDAVATSATGFLLKANNYIDMAINIGERVACRGFSGASGNIIVTPLTQ